MLRKDNELICLIIGVTHFLFCTYFPDFGGGFLASIFGTPKIFQAFQNTA